MYVLVAMFCLVASPLVSDCHITVGQELLGGRDQCIEKLKQLTVIEAKHGYLLKSGKCHPILRTDI